MPINQDQFWDSNAKIWVTYPINSNIAIILVIFNKKYVVVKAMRRSSGISKILLMKRLKSKVYVSFRIRLYVIFGTLSFRGCGGQPLPLV